MPRLWIASRGREVFQVGVEHPKERFDVVGRRGDREVPVVLLAVLEAQLQRQRGWYPVNGPQTQDQLIEETPKYEEQRLHGLDLVLELQALLVRNGQGSQS